MAYENLDDYLAQNGLQFQSNIGTDNAGFAAHDGQQGVWLDPMDENGGYGKYNSLKGRWDSAYPTDDDPNRPAWGTAGAPDFMLSGAALNPEQGESPGLFADAQGNLLYRLGGAGLQGGGYDVMYDPKYGNYARLKDYLKYQDRMMVDQKGDDPMDLLPIYMAMWGASAAAAPAAAGGAGASGITNPALADAAGAAGQWGGTTVGEAAGSLGGLGGAPLEHTFSPDVLEHGADLFDAGHGLDVLDPEVVDPSNPIEHAPDIENPTDVPHGSTTDFMPHDPLKPSWLDKFTPDDIKKALSAASTVSKLLGAGSGSTGSTGDNSGSGLSIPGSLAGAGTSSGPTGWKPSWLTPTTIGGDGGTGAVQVLPQLQQLYGGLSQVRGMKRGGKVVHPMQGALPVFRTDKVIKNHVQGPGDGQSDDIPAMLADGEYVFDADTVSALGNGSNKAGAAALDSMRVAIRKHKRAAPHDKIPPKAKQPLDYLRSHK